MNHVVIWSKPDCPYCTRAKSALHSRNIAFEERVLGRDFTREILLESYPTAKSFPVIVIDGFYIGGYTQLEQKLNESFNDTRTLLNETNNL